MTISLFSKKDSYVECKLCPHRCQLKAGESGKCSVRLCDGDTIFLSNYGELVSVAVNPIEKKPFRKYLPSTKTLSIGGVGCSLNCKFCEQNRISQSRSHKDLKYFSAESIVSIAIEKHCKSVCMTFNEPTISFEYLIDLADACHKTDLKFILKTNAYVNQEPWAEICRVTDAVNVDFKGCEAQYKEITGAEDFVIMDRIKEAYEAGVHLEISIPLYDFVSEDIEYLSQFLSSLDKDIPCHLLKVNPSYQFLERPPTDPAILEQAKEIMLLYINNIFMV